jgi:hypothetical protein
LRDYFGPEHVFYVPPHDVPALQHVLDTIVANPALALERAQAASRHFAARDYTTRQFALQHVRLTQEFMRTRHMDMPTRPSETALHAELGNVAPQRRVN